MIHNINVEHDRLSERQRAALEKERNDLLSFERKRQERGKEELPAYAKEHLRQINEMLNEIQKETHEQTKQITSVGETSVHEEELFPGVKRNQIEQKGNIIYEKKRESPATIICYCHCHGSEELAEYVQFRPDLVLQFVENQNQVLESLICIRDAVRPTSAYFIFENINEEFETYMMNPSTAEMVRIVTDIEKEWGHDKRRILKRISEDGTLANYFLRAMGAGQRFFVDCYRRNLLHVLRPGRPPSIPFVQDEIRQDLETIRSNLHAIGDDAIGVFIRKWRERLKEDHRLRHAFIKHQISQISHAPGLAVLLMGGDHFRSSYDPPGSYKTELPLEDDLNESSLYIVEPSSYRTLIDGISAQSISLFNTTPATLREHLASSLG